ncbi:MAG: MBL fold metallo-hydrolase [Chloroflexi bacterium]|nr:MBL fold metallo-hydrolase [Chloroflexota bacterium]
MLILTVAGGATEHPRFPQPNKRRHQSVRGRARVEAIQPIRRNHIRGRTIMAIETPIQPRGQFYAAPLFTQPVMPWIPDYGSLEDSGQSIHVGGDVYVYRAPEYGLNVTSLYAITRAGVIVLDTQLLPKYAEEVVRDIRARTDQPIRFVSNSHHHPDHMFGNEVFRREGAELVSSYLTARLIDGHGFWYLMLFNGLWGGHLPQTYVVPRTTYSRFREIELGGTCVQLMEFGDGATAGGESVDLTVAWFPEQRVLHVSDLLLSQMHPVTADGTSTEDWLVQLDQLRTLVRELQPRVIVPGHGNPGDVGLIDAQERYLNTLRRLVLEHCDGGEAPLTDDRRAQLRAAIVSEFPRHRLFLALDMTLSFIQMVGPQAFLFQRSEAPAPPRIPTFL